jgi:hypothetical protein
LLVSQALVPETPQNGRVFLREPRRKQQKNTVRAGEDRHHTDRHRHAARIARHPCLSIENADLPFLPESFGVQEKRGKIRQMVFQSSSPDGTVGAAAQGKDWKWILGHYDPSFQITTVLAPPEP